MTQQQLEQLEELVRSRRQRDFGTGNSNYDLGVDTGRDNCADALEELIRDWRSTEN